MSARVRATLQNLWANDGMRQFRHPGLSRVYENNSVWGAMNWGSSNNTPLVGVQPANANRAAAGRRARRAVAARPAPSSRPRFKPVPDEDGSVGRGDAERGLRPARQHEVVYENSREVIVIYDDEDADASESEEDREMGSDEDLVPQTRGEDESEDEPEGQAGGHQDEPQGKEGGYEAESQGEEGENENESEGDEREDQDEPRGVLPPCNDQLAKANAQVNGQLYAWARRLPLWPPVASQLMAQPGRDDDQVDVGMRPPIETGGRADVDAEATTQREAELNNEAACPVQHLLEVES